LRLADEPRGDPSVTEPIDVDALLAPLESGEQGAGTDLRSDYSATSPYQRLRDARAAARAEERARDAEGDSDGQEAAGWRDVFSVGQQALAGQSKDFEIAAWLTEAMVRLHGLSGLTAGARLITGLCETYWDSGFPQPDEDGYEGRSSPIGGLSGAGADGTIMQPLRRLALFRRADGSPIGVYQWEQSEQVEAMDPKRQKARYEAGTPELKALEAEARLDRPYLTGLGRQLGPAIAAWKAMETALDQRFGAESPSIRKVSGLLDRML
jgi:type VI secretion system protein ImpA